MKISHYILLLFISTLSFNIYSQDTIQTYYDKDWNPIDSSSNTFYYGTFFQVNDSLWKRIDYYSNGQLQMQGQYKDSLQENAIGTFNFFYENGALEETKEYNKDSTVKKIEYYESGQQKSSINYSQGLLEGKLVTYWENGKIHHDELYHKGKIVSGKTWKDNGTEEEFHPYLVMPEYKGGNKKLYKFLQRNLTYPKECYKKKITGKVIIEFTVAKDGSIINIRTIQNPDDRLTDEALRVINLMPKWEPGKTDNIPVNVLYRLPINFQL